VSDREAGTPQIGSPRLVNPGVLYKERIVPGSGERNSEATRAVWRAKRARPSVGGGGETSYKSFSRTRNKEDGG